MAGRSGDEMDKENIRVLRQAHKDLDLSKHNEEQEAATEERTAELMAINRELLREIDAQKRVEAKLLQRNRELLSLQAALTAIASSLDQQFVLDTVTWEMASLLETEGCTILEWDEEMNTVSVIAEYPFPDRQGSAPDTANHNLGDCPLRQLVLQERCAQQVTASQADADPVERAYLQSAGLKTLLMIPMVFQGRVVGLAEITDGQTERTFSDHQISLAQLLAHQAASAVENARLYEQSQQEIRRRRQAEEQITASLREKEVLLKEVHHRVKNNLQVISSLLYLQSQSTSDPDILAMFLDSQSRVRSMALIHERLYQTEDLARIDFSRYTRDLAEHLLHSYSIEAGAIILQVEADDMALGVDVAVPCGLILNELLSNSLKHAFPGQGHPPTGRSAVIGESTGQEDPAMPDRPQIQVELRSGGEGSLHLRVADNGVGFPQDLDFRDTASLGLQLVNILVSQLDGKIELQVNGGTEFRIALNAA
jgi:two-component sensor histidine kinase